ncbi:MAG: glycosyltransferase family 4 protein [Acidimicrobiales bacterium]
MPESQVWQLLGPSTGGIRRHVGYLAQTLADRGWGVRVAGPAKVMDGLTQQHAVVEVPVSPRPLSVLVARRQLAALEPPGDLIHAHGLKAGWIAAGQRRGRPLVVSVHNITLDDPGDRSYEPTPRDAPVPGARDPCPDAEKDPPTRIRPALRLLRDLEARLVGRTDAVIAVSAHIAERLGAQPESGRREPGRSRITVIPPAGPRPVPRRSRAQVREDLGLRPGTALVVSAARLHPQKDLGTLVAAVAQLRSAGTEVAVVIAGTGPSRGDLEAQTSRLGLSEAVTFLGSTDHPADLLGAADVVAISSVWESGPLALTEAMHLGRPVVSTPVGLAPELVIDGQTGLLVPVGDEVAMARALAWMLANPADASRMGQAGAQRLAARYRPEDLVGAVEEVYRRVLSGTRR